jgi:hypothetical protein
MAKDEEKRNLQVRWSELVYFFAAAFLGVGFLVVLAFLGLTVFAAF